MSSSKGIMRVKCINNADDGGELKINKEYEVQEETFSYYYLTDIAGGWWKSRFVIVEDRHCPQCHSVH